MPFVFLLSLARVERTPLQTELGVGHAFRLQAVLNFGSSVPKTVMVFLLVKLF